MTTASFVVPGPPQPKQRPRLGRQGCVYTPKATRAYEDCRSLCARQAGLRTPSVTPVCLAIALYFPDRRRRDLDNAAKAVMDALNGVGYRDDSQVQTLHVTRAIDAANRRVEIAISPTGA